jgi:hypothetical protein
MDEDHRGSRIAHAFLLAGSSFATSKAPPDDPAFSLSSGKHERRLWRSSILPWFRFPSGQAKIHPCSATGWTMAVLSGDAWNCAGPAAKIAA